MKENYLQWLWLGVSRPRDFFAGFPSEPRLALALKPALVAVLLGATMFGWAIARGTSSDSVIAVMLLVLPGALLYAATLWLLGGMALARTARIGEHGWEIAAWAWVPAGYLALILLPVVAVFPVTSLATGMLGLPFWHLYVVHAGLGRFAPARARRALVVYVVVVLAVPLTLLATLAGLILWSEASVVTFVPPH